MIKNDCIIRLETEEDYREAETLVREAFWNVYRPGCLEHYVLHCLREDKDFVPELDFVMEKDGRLIGQIIFVKAELTDDSGKVTPILTMGPVSIAKNLQGCGYGKTLVTYALGKAAELGYGAVCIEGDIDFYSKCGFGFATERGLKYHGLPDGVDASFFLCCELVPGYLDGVSGEYATPDGYFVDESMADAFDEQFPYMEKLKLEGQLE